jgi:hypothetical protein
LGPYWALLSHLGRSSWASWEPSWAILKPSWAHLGLSWGHLGPILGPSWALLGSVLGSSLASLGPSWASLRPSWALLGLSWGHLGAILGLSWGHLGILFGPPLGSHIRLPRGNLSEIRGLSQLVLSHGKAMFFNVCQRWFGLGDMFGDLGPGWAMMCQDGLEQGRSATESLGPGERASQQPCEAPSWAPAEKSFYH